MPLSRTAPADRLPSQCLLKASGRRERELDSPWVPISAESAVFADSGAGVSSELAELCPRDGQAHSAETRTKAAKEESNLLTEIESSIFIFILGFRSKQAAASLRRIQMQADSKPLDPARRSRPESKPPFRPMPLGGGAAARHQ
jgi:hypothetical protein